VTAAGGVGAPFNLNNSQIYQGSQPANAGVATANGGAVSGGSMANNASKSNGLPSQKSQRIGSASNNGPSNIGYTSTGGHSIRHQERSSELSGQAHMQQSVSSGHKNILNDYQNYSKNFQKNFFTR
jgi:hypothetical protein